jgi:hypothetical protein
MSRKTASKQDEKEGLDELQKKVERFRDDGFYDVYIRDWKKIDDNQVRIYFTKPNGEMQSETMDWPSKPVKNNQFIKTCMDALDLDSPENAAMMAENLKNAEAGTYRTRADVDENYWRLCPEIRDESDDSGSSPESKAYFDVLITFLSFMLGPTALLCLTIVGTERGYWFTDCKSSSELYWFAVA